MADTGSLDAGTPSLNLTPEEKRVFGQLFRQADTENLGVVTGEVAVKFFEKTRLEPRILGEIWQIADKENRGLLTPAGFGIVLRLIGHYQAGLDPTPELAFRPGPLPKFDGGLPGAPAIQPPPKAFSPPLQAQTSGSGLIRVPPLTPDKVAQYSALFDKSGAQNGVLPGEQAKQIFERAGLPNETLGQIWNLADTEQRGALVMTEFIIAMHLLASFKSGALRLLPAILPAGLYEAAARRPQPRQMSGTVPSVIPRQFSGAGAVRGASPLSRSAYPPPPPAAQVARQMSGQAGDWAVSPADKSRFDGIYATLDRTGRGYITGDEAVPFFSNSKLPEEALAQIWDLADINSQGRLTREEFAVAMYLIRQQRGKQDGRSTLPTSLPSNLVPPSMRNQVRPPTQPTAPAFDTSAPTIPKSSADDLFGLDVLSSPSPTALPSQVPQTTGGSTGLGESFGNSRSPMTPSSPTQGSPQAPSGFKPFVPSSFFGRSLDHHTTGGSNSSAPGQPLRAIQPQSTGMDDLLGDNDPEVSKKLTDETTELANLSNQVGTLSTQMQNVQGQRTTTHNELNQATSQKREFEVRLAQLRSLYEQEVKDVKGLEERLSASRNETKKLQQDIAMIEGTYQDLQNQHREISSALQADQHENATLKERMRALNAEIAQMKPQLEKLRSEARQQKGLVAINKKQLATVEAEREKLKTESEDLTKSIEEDTRSLALSSQSQAPVTVASPAPSTMSANNPFFRRQGSTSESVSSPFAQSPAPAQAESSFENVFGPSFAAASTPQNGAPPTTTFRQETQAEHAVPVTATETALPTHPTEASHVSSPASQSAQNQDISGTSEIPALPESRQISSGLLPFPSDNTESLSSSRQVSAPNSRFGDGNDSSTGTETPNNYTGVTPTGSSAGGYVENAPEPVAPVEPRSVSNSTTSIPGAFPGDGNSNVAATPTGGSTISEPATGSNDAGPVDPFAFRKEESRASTVTKDDFDSAFAGFKGATKTQDKQSNTFPSEKSTGPRKVDQEFPPLQELERDDDSDSASESGGFEDDFTSASPGHLRKETSENGIAGPTAFTAGSDSLFAPRPIVPTTASALSVGTNPPSENAQKSPPPYDSSVSSHDKAHAEADQYVGLLPTREDPTSPTLPSHSPERSFSNPPVAGGQALFSSTSAESNTPAPPAKVPFDDFDNEFDDLEDAKEGDADDDFANISVHDRSGMDDFNSVFDSQPESKASIHTAQGSSGFGGSTNGFGDYTQSPTRAAVEPSTAGPATSGVHDSHDWDAIFAGLDGPNPTVSTLPLQGHDDDITPAPPAQSTATSSGIASSTSTKNRPQIGRALTEAGVHDDPILKNLTGMGYARGDALAALEKYDYNLERAANYLASQS
ncbi:MAG: hypothetical protein M1818_003968 [Claussenomyces sp. TS43310]|nr:MAG: hypothetical protein M1818_003968 [Claussenomyces sp. TS43310]